MSDTTAEALDGMLPFVALIAVLGEPTKDGRTLTADGRFDLPGDIPVVTGPRAQALMGREPIGSSGVIVGLVAGVTRRGDRLYALGVAEPDVAEGLNAETLRLGMDLDGMKLTADPMTIKQGTIRAARLVEPEEFAWT